MTCWWVVFVRYYGEGWRRDRCSHHDVRQKHRKLPPPPIPGLVSNTNGIASYSCLNQLSFNRRSGSRWWCGPVFIWQEAANDDIFYIGGIYNDPLLNGKDQFCYSPFSFMGLPSGVSDVASIPALVDLDGDRDIDVDVGKHAHRYNALSLLAKTPVTGTNRQRLLRRDKHWKQEP